MATVEAGASLVAREDGNWRKSLISQLRERNKHQTNCFADLISLRKSLTRVFLAGRFNIRIIMRPTLDTKPVTQYCYSPYVSFG